MDHKDPKDAHLDSVIRSQYPRRSQVEIRWVGDLLGCIFPCFYSTLTVALHLPNNNHAAPESVGFQAVKALVCNFEPLLFRQG